jgi:hypothetical protein
MSAFALTQELKLENINFDTTLLPKHNPYIGYFPSVWPLLFLEPRCKDASTQTEPFSYYELGRKVAMEYGEGWESLCAPSVAVGTK